MKHIAEISNSILFFISTHQLYLQDIDEDNLLRKKQIKRDKELTSHIQAFLKKFAMQNKFWDSIVQYGMTFAKKNRAEPYFFDAHHRNIDNKFKKWLDKYQNRAKVPMRINELLCRPIITQGKEAIDKKKQKQKEYFEYWNKKEYKFPMIILYENNIPYFIRRIKNRNTFEAVAMQTSSFHLEMFKDDLINATSTFKADIDKLHFIFSQEKYSSFKIFFTSNFKGMHSQTFIKFRKPICNIKSETELTAFLGLCFLIDTAIGSVIYDFDRIINYHEYYGQLLKHGTKAAMTAIMSRNLSHNIGSHVLSYWNQELSKTLPRNPSNYNDKDITISKSKELFQYIQQRMDFLAELSTSVPCSEVSLDIQNDILNPVLCPFGGSALLEYLAKSEGIDLHGRVIIEIDKNVKSRRVSIPNGLIGMHGIYSILENFIRNCAKHYKGKSKAIGLIKIVIKEPIQTSLRDKYLVMRIWDMRPNSCNRDTLNKLRQYLPRGKKYSFTEEGRLSPEGWGLKEMITSANFLRKYEPEMLLSKFNKGTPSLIEILCGDNNDRPSCEKNKDNLCCNSRSEYKKRLGIRLYLMKPKDLAVSISSSIEIKKNIFAIEEKKLFYNEIPHRILLVDNQLNEKKHKADPRKPCRIILDHNLPKIIDDDYYLSLYENFIKYKINENSILPQLSYQGAGGRGGGFFVKRGELQTIPDTIKDYFFKSGEIEWRWNSSNKIELITNALKVLLYYYHAESPSERHNLHKLVEKGVYVQPVSGGYSTHAKLTSIGLLSNHKLQKHFALELIEAASTKIIIIDERVSEWVKGSFNGVEIKQILRNMNIFIPEVALDQISAKHITSTLREFPNVHFIVIHQGILDKMENKKKNTSGLFMKNIISTKCIWKVVDSGRGVPSNLFKDARFVEISSLLRMLQEYDKHGLAQSLYSSRHPQKTIRGVENDV